MSFGCSTVLLNLSYEALTLEAPFKIVADVIQKYILFYFSKKITLDASCVSCAGWCFNPCMPSRLFYLRSLDEYISIKRDVRLVFLSPCFIYIPVLNANSVDPDQTPHSVASDLGPHCLPMSHFWDARLKWVKSKHYSITYFLTLKHPAKL